MSSIYRSYYYDQTPPPKKRSRLGLYIFLVLLVALVIAIGFCIHYIVSMPATTPTLSLPDIMPSVAEESTTTTTTTVERGGVGSGLTLELLTANPEDTLTFQEIYKKNIDSIVSIECSTQSGTSSGTGVIFSQSGYIVTNAHVVQGAAQVEVILSDARSYAALLVGMDTNSDLAVLKIDANNLTAAEFGDSDSLAVGDVALAIGNPLGSELLGTMTDGIISALNRDVTVDDRTMVLIQTTAALNSGNSGGALINELGQVIGITTLKMMSNYDTIEGLGFAIPTTTAKEIVDELLEYGHLVNRPTIGITVNTLPTTLEDGTTGLTIIDVEEVSDAWAQGLLPGDIVTCANGISLDSYQTLVDVKSTLSVGDTLTCIVWREEEYLTIEFALIELYLLDE